MNIYEGVERLCAIWYMPACALSFYYQTKTLVTEC